MFHEPSSDFLYSAYLIESEFVDDCGTRKFCDATGFVLDVGTSVAYFVTNKHVCDLNFRQASSKYRNFSLDKVTITGRRPDDTQYSYVFHDEAIFYTHPNKDNDVALIEIRVWGASAVNDDEGLHWHFGLSHLASEKDFEEIRPFDLVAFSGFPPQHDKLGKRPIVRSGRIASDPKFDYSWNSSNNGNCVAYEGFSFGGSSGSPVYAPPRGSKNIPGSRNGMLIGVNAGHVPTDRQEHSAISYFYKSTVILDIIEHYRLNETTIS